MTDRTAAPQAAALRPRSRGGPLLALALGLFVAPAVTGCAGQAAAPTWTDQPVATMAGTTTGSSGTAMQAAWAARPAYARTNARTEEAYAYAMASADVLRWMPCYCGCGTMGHGSNADCFFKPTMDGLSSLTFEEHASYCDVCVDTALMVKQMRGDGQSLRAIRDAVDARFGSGGAPGTPTELPPA